MPHLIVVRPGGDVQYCGGDRKKFFSILSRELVRQRKALEKEN